MGELGQPQTDILMPRLSPDQKSAVVRSAESGAHNIWIHTAGKKSRLTFEEDADRPAWHPSGQFISFSSGRGGNMDIYLQKVGRFFSTPTSGGNTRAPILDTTGPRMERLSWARRREPARVAMSITTGEKQAATGKRRPFVETEFDEYSADVVA